MNDELSLVDIKSLLLDWLGDGHEVIFYPNPGNAGDCLIASATWQLFDEIKLNPITLNPRDFKPNSKVILGGGGNLVPQYHATERGLMRCLEVGVNQCLLLPSTIRGHEELLGKLDSRFTIVCRDMESFKHVSQYTVGVKAFLAPDIAFNLKVPLLLKRSKSIVHKFKLIFDKDWSKWRVVWRRALVYQRNRIADRLLIFRCDVEAKYPPSSNKLADLNEHFMTRCMGRASCDQVSSDIFRLLMDAKAVSTDRLHIAIPSLLLKRPLKVRDNNYGKLSAVLGLIKSKYSNYELID